MGLTAQGSAPADAGPEADTEAASRPLRADAARNRARILAAAEAVFAAEGIEVPVDVIAQKARVGVGTLYRHFPTKEKLWEAILLERFESLTVDAQALADADDPAAAFFAFLDHVVEESAAKRDLIVAVMGAGLAFDPSVSDIKESLHAAVEVLLRRAQGIGVVRSDVTATAVMALAGATCQAASYDDTPSSDLLAIVCDGLRTRGG